MGKIVTQNLRKISVNLPIELIEKIMIYSKKHSYTYTMSYQILLERGLQSEEAFEYMPTLLEALQKQTTKSDAKSTKK